jgi:alginate O-acetyltransferase complex protein AlgI
VRICAVGVHRWPIAFTPLLIQLLQPTGDLSYNPRGAAMLFTTYAFFLFFLITFSVFWIGRQRTFQLVWLLVASIAFYAFWNPWFLLLIAFSTSIDYIVALRLPRESSPSRRRALLIASVGVNLTILAAFKYSLFLLQTMASAAGLAGLSVSPPVFTPLLPLGLSFYTFEAISYVVDVYRGRLTPVRSPLHYALYILFFPHLISGPIVRGQEFLPQLERPRRPDWLRLEMALGLFTLGLFKKVVLADRLPPIIDPVFASPASYSTGTLWLAAFGFSVQAYCDFSGYSDMAIALAHSFDIKLPANFRTPYFSPNIAEFWRRWHMTLSRWMRDYIYIPLGGSRGSEIATSRNLVLTMALGGLRHGAAWHYVAWGVYHGVLLAGHRVWTRGRAPTTVSGIWLPVSIAVTYFFICIGLVLFRADSIGVAGSMLARMLWPAQGVALTAAMQTTLMSVLGIAFAGHLLETVKLQRTAWRLPAPIRGAALATGAVLIQFLTPAQGPAFLYFQF